MKIAGKTILVTGSSSGLGAACAQRLLEQGANVVGLDRAAEASWQNV
ncbi:MAG: short chain dehydrogenase, partial [Planctomycetota bacterium]